jgi:hypothetical protein
MAFLNSDFPTAEERLDLKSLKDQTKADGLGKLLLSLRLTLKAL